MKMNYPSCARGGLSKGSGDRRARGFVTLKGCGMAVLCLAFILPAEAGWLFSGEVFYSGDDPNDVTVSDINGDGLLDIITANGNNIDIGNVGVLLGQSGGGFAAAVNYDVGQQPWSVTVGDVNDDGLMDVVTANYRSGVSVLLGQIGGGFAPAQSYVSGMWATAVALGDVNGDGQVDLIATSIFDSVSVLHGQSGGGFTDAGSYVVGKRPRAVAVRDVNGDDRLDIVTSNSNGGDVSVLLGLAGGGFSSAVNYTVGAAPRGLAIGDLDGDGWVDIVTANSSSDTISILYGLSGGGFAAAVDYAAGDAPRDVTLDDMNDDGRLDIIVANHGSADVSLLLARAGGGFSPSVNYDAGISYALSSVTTGDLNGDGRPDVVVAHDYQSSSAFSGIAVLFGQADGMLAAPGRHAVAAFPEALVMGDLDGDGLTDMATVSWGSDSVSVLRGLGGGMFAPVVNYRTEGDRPRALAMGDVTGDGRPDLVAANGASASISVLPALAGGGFGAAEVYPVDNGPIGVAIDDMNRDGRLDIVTSNLDAGSVSVLHARSGGGFASAVHYPVGRAPSSIKLADFNGDGRPDIATGSEDNFVNVVLAQPGGGYAAAVTYTVGRIPRSIAIGDIDGDGAFDIVTSNSTDQDVSVLLGMGDGTFEQASDYPLDSLSHPDELTLGDLDGDGRDDLMVTGTDYGLSILFGQADGSLGMVRHMVLNTGGGAIAIGDMNHDGGLDIAVADYVNNDAVLLLNAAAASTIIAHDDRTDTTRDRATTTGNVLVNDVGAGLNVTAFDTSSIQGGVVTDNTDGTFTYRPPVGFLGIDTFSYTIADSQGRTDRGTVTVAVLDGSGTGGGGSGGGSGSSGGGSSATGGGGGGGLSPIGLLAGLLFVAWKRRPGWHG